MPWRPIAEPRYQNRLRIRCLWLCGPPVVEATRGQCELPMAMPGDEHEG